MKKATGVTDSYPDFFRCHRAYIVNLDKIEQVVGNAQGCNIKLQGMEDRISVSRNLNGEFSDGLAAFRNREHIRVVAIHIVEKAGVAAVLHPFNYMNELPVVCNIAVTPANGNGYSIHLNYFGGV